MYKSDIKELNTFYRNLPVKDLVHHIVQNDEGRVGMRGAAMIDTGIYTGRSPNDKYFVDEPSSRDKIWWGSVNRKVDESIFDHLYNKVVDYYNNGVTNSYLFDGFAGADKTYQIKVRIIAKKAWQAHFAHNMFIRSDKEELEEFEPDFTIINASDIQNEDFQKHGLNSKTFVLFHIGRRVAIIGGTEYGGEMKKGIFSVLHYLLPQQGVLSMHCSANTDKNGENSAIFFGLSGTGKTTLSTDPHRPLIGDDEHGWSDNGIFNFEGGCYAKVINLNPEHEPDIYNAIREGALLENVVYNEDSNQIDFSDDSKTPNTRVSYPLEHIENSLLSQGKNSTASHPKNIIFLTCDAYGVLPPVAKLTPEQAMYHFISGYTAKVAGTERGVLEPTATFSPCFGGPFLTLHPLIYAELLKEKMNKYNVPAYLVNTGWIGSNASSGSPRISLPITRNIIHKILDGTILTCEFEIDPLFGFHVPTKLDDINSNILSSKNMWKSEEAYFLAASELIQKFQDNFSQYDINDNLIKNSGPIIN